MLLAKNALIPATRRVVYCYHFSRPVSPFHTCQHYVGYADDLEERDADHRAGRGARANITWATRTTWRSGTPTIALGGVPG